MADSERTDNPPDELLNVSEWMEQAVQAYFEQHPQEAKEALAPHAEKAPRSILIVGPLSFIVTLPRRGGSIQNRRIAAQMARQETTREVVVPEAGMELVIYCHPDRAVINTRIASLLPVRAQPNWQVVYYKGGHCAFTQH